MILPSWNQRSTPYISVLFCSFPPILSPSRSIAPSIYHQFNFSQAPYYVIYDFSRTIKSWKNRAFLPCPRTADLTPCTPPVQRTGSTPSPSWPVEIQPPHSSSGPPNSWRAPSPSCSVPVAAKGAVKKRLSLRRQESKGTAAGSSLLALAICEVQVPKLKSSDESWATLKWLVKVVMGEWVRWGGRADAQKSVFLGLSGSQSEIYGAHHLKEGNKCMVKVCFLLNHHHMHYLY